MLGLAGSDGLALSLMYIYIYTTSDIQNLSTQPPISHQTVLIPSANHPSNIYTSTAPRKRKKSQRGIKSLYHNAKTPLHQPIKLPALNFMHIPGPPL